ncbi:MAG TPA: tape measure protein [Nitrospira sp.]|nr:tape measure protein [Nitrospira sp.]
MGQNNQLGVQVVADIADFQKKFDDMKSQLSSIGESTKQSGEQAATGLAGVRKEVESIGTMLKSGLLIEGGRMITDMVTAPLIGLGKEAVMLADNLHKSEIAFGVMLGSGEKARELLRDLQQFAATTPFEFPELVRAAQKMKAFGIEADQIVPTMRTVGDAVAGLGGTSEMFDRIIRAMGQMDAKGKVSAQEMNQFAEAGINAWQAVANALGITVAEAMDKAKAGQIDAATALTAIQADMVTKFGGMMTEQSKTIQGTLANLKDTIGFILTDIGQQLIDTLQLREVLGSIQSFAQGVLTWFRGLDDGTKKTVIALTGAFAAGGPILVAVGAFMAAMTIITAPMLVTGAIITGIVAGAALLIAHWTTLKTTASTIWGEITGTIADWGLKTNQAIDAAIFGTVAAFRNLKDTSIKLMADMVTGIGNWLGGRLTAIFDKVKAPIEAVKGYFAGLYDAVVGHSYIPDMVEEIGDHMRNLDVAMTAPARNAVVNTGRVIETGVMTWQMTINQFATTANQAWGSLAQTVGNSIAQMTQGYVDWGAVMQQLGTQVLASFATTAIQTVAQWVIASAQRIAASTAEAAQVLTIHTGLEAARTAVTGTQEAARLGIALATNKAIMAGVIATLSGIAAVGNAALATMGVVVTTTSGVLAAIGSALVGTIIGAPLGAAYLAASAAVLGVGGAAVATGLGAVQAAIGSAIGLAASSLALPAFADGGAVFGPTLALVGENASRGNPEYIGHANQLGLNRSGGRQTIILQLDGRTLAEATMSHMPGVYKLAMGNR